MNLPEQLLRTRLFERAAHGMGRAAKSHQLRAEDNDSAKMIDYGLAKLETIISKHNWLEQSFSQALMPGIRDQTIKELSQDPGPQHSVQQRYRPNGLDRAPTCCFPYGKFIARRPISWVGVCRNSIDKNANSQFKG